MAITANQKVLTLDYWKRADQLVPGDIVFDRLGQPAKVTVAASYRAQKCYELQFNDHLTLAGDSKLGLVLESRRYRNREIRYKGTRPHSSSLTITNLDTILEEPVLYPKTGNSKYSIQTTNPIQLPHQDLPVPPFVFGYWLMNHRPDGRMRAYPPVADAIYQEFKDCGYLITKNNIGFWTAPTISSQLAPFYPTSIPNNYLMASPEQRIQLLRGLIHSKARTYNQKSYTFRLTTANYPLAKQIQWLVESLGHRSSMYAVKKAGYYSVCFHSKLKLHQHQEPKPLKWTMDRRFLRKIKEIPSQQCVHIETTAPDSTILVGEGFIACH